MATQVAPLQRLKLPSGPSPITAEQRHWHSTFVIDVSDTFEQKLEAIRCYESQFDAARFAKLRHFVTGYDVYAGGRCGFLYGELFALATPIGAADLYTLVRGGDSSPAAVQLPGEPPPAI